MTETLTGLGTTNVTIGLGVAAVINGYTLGDNAALLDLGTVTDDGPFVFGYDLGDETLTIATGAVFEMAAGGTISEPTSNTSSIVNAGLFAAAGTAASTVAVPVFNLSGGTLASGAAGLDLVEGGTIGGTLQGPGEIDLGDGSFLLFASAVGALGTLAIGAGGTAAVVNLNGDLTVASELELFGGSALASGSTLLNNNLLLGTGSGVSAIEMSFTNGNTATIDSNIGTLAFTDGGILAGTLDGTGEIDLAAGDFLLLPNALIDVAGLVIGSGADLTLDANFSFANTLSLAGGTIDLNGYTLDLSSPGDIGGGFTGNGTLDISGSANVSDLSLEGSETVNFTGKFGSFNGSLGSADALFSIASGSTWETDGLNKGSGDGTIVNSGTLIALASAMTDISANFIQTSGGVIDIKKGALLLEDGATIVGSIVGKGELELNTMPQAGNGNLVLSSYIDLSASVIDVAALDVGINVGLGANLSYAGAFTVSNIAGNDFQPYLQLNGHTLDLAGNATIDGDITGPGLVKISGSALLGVEYMDAPIVIQGGILTSYYTSFLDGLSFHGAGELIMKEGIPSGTISGFGPGDKIKLAGIKYHAGAKVKVKEAGVVEIIDGGETYSLNIAGATVGSTDFSFSKGSVLTTSAKQKMNFLRPGTAAPMAAASDAVTVAPPMKTALADRVPATISAAQGWLGQELLGHPRIATDVPTVHWP